MKWIVLGLALAAAGFFGWGWHTDHATDVVDDRLASLVPYLIAFVLMSADLVIGVLWALLTILERM